MNKSYKNTTIAILLACILTMAIGYAVLQQRLDISGTSKITSEFNIQVTGISEFASDGYAETANMDFTPTSATYSTNIKAPGDYMIYEIVIENKGTLDGYAVLDGYPDSMSPDFPEIYEDRFYMTIVHASKEKAITEDDLYENSTEISSLPLLAPGEKLYIYPMVELSQYATDLPEKTKFEQEVKFDFYTKEYVKDTYGIKEPLLSVIKRTNPVVTTGNGMYHEQVTRYGDEYDLYTFRSDSNGNVNNYILVGDKMWRIMDFDVDDLGYTTYKIIEDDDTLNNNTVFSTVANANGLYNGFSSSTLINKIFDYYDTISYVIFGGVYGYPDDAYVENTETFEDPDNEYSYHHVIPDIERVMKASTNSSCTFANLSNGGCKSWLTNNGDTYLYAKVYESDKTTNTGNIAYLQDGKVIAVDPQDTNYGEYKMIAELGGGCDLVVTNPDVGDGSKSNPYIISIADEDMCIRDPE